MVDFKHAKRNRRLDHWIVVTLLFVFCLGLNFLISKVDRQLDLSSDSKYSLSRETLALLNKIDQPIDLIVTLPDSSSMPKIIQRFMHDLDLLLDAFERADTPFPIMVHRVDVNAPTRQRDVLDQYKVSQANQVIAASPKNGTRVVFRYEETPGVNPYDSTLPFRSAESIARQAIWDAGFYSEWKEVKNGILEPGSFRGEETLMRTILELADGKKSRKVAYFTRGHGEASPTDTNPKDGNSIFRSLFEDRNVAVASIDLGTVDQIPNDALALVLSGPKAIFQDKEVALIRNFLNLNGGQVLIALDPKEELTFTDRPSFGLRSLLKEWGLRCHDMLIHDPSPENFDLFSGAYFLRTYQRNETHPLVKNLVAEGFSILADRCRPVEAVQAESSLFLTKELLFSSRDSWALSSWTERPFPPDKNPLLDLSGPVPVLAISQPKHLPASATGVMPTGKLMVLGCSKILSNERLVSGAGNQSIARNIIYWLKGNNEMLDIPPRSVQSYSVSMSKQDYEKTFYYFSLVPGFVFLAGIFVSWLRKEL